MFNKRNKKNDNTIMNLGEKEEEIIDSYKDDEEYEEIEETEREEMINKAKRNINIFFTIIIILIILVTIDIVAVSRYNKGPFFAIPVYSYKDGGTKEYYGIGYKVIKYNQLQGRRDKEIGLWSLKYNTEPITLQDIDLAIEFTGNEATTYQKYNKKFVRIISTLQKVDNENHKITLGYHDEGGKYSLDIICKVVEDQNNITTFEEGKEITIIGTISDFKIKSEKKNNRLYISNCFAEQ